MSTTDNTPTEASQDSEPALGAAGSQLSTAPSRTVVP